MNNLLITLDRAVQLLDESEVVAIPTETVYGLAARIDRPLALEKIFSTKERPFFDPLIVHVDSIDQAIGCVLKWPLAAQILAMSFWPGPLTLVLEKKPEVVSDLITAGLPTVGLRMPAHVRTLELLKRVKTPLAAPSANKFKQTSPTSAGHVLSGLPGVSVLEGGACQVGIESTIVQIVNENIDEKKITLQILRPGMIHADHIKDVLGEYFTTVNIVTEQSSSFFPHAPGMMKDHYCPELPLILADELAPNFTTQLKENDLFPTQALQLPSDPTLAARALYSELHKSANPNARSLTFFKRSIGPTQWSDAQWEPLRDRITKAATWSFVNQMLSKK